ncbi:acyl-CoA dehydrogenase [Arthrobacter sp. TPD3018]|jgi:alkylation response protein AidB-like acyl-CoA dehydrogenase|uniref:acyl-CoA dehydrogenase family protein n=2 Tax=cellular organisms TaxID=131567 RepID=UPI00037490CB|nr:MULTISPECIES: acyl-CoA dehydrogenase family protein [Bacteria]MBA4681601.1 acyl-CoA/acyl-ACP dehydrogenase [Pseudomonas sp.]MDE0945312.1 acyl-CoA/acyl-ACP dehydrogenase [Sphingobium sp.]OYW46666.1 MAG: acyl-CoA dehydrogenase [Novosphingobium sp. 12-63-9]OYX16993.1 MAG: acyl-CoA dehydrogenase [Sphingomonadales bacterium 32-67-7]PVE50769.1 acyl-CoA dehydrogenase [Arthrobacter sp. TPD3018]
MEFQPDEEQRMAVESVRRFLDDKLEPEIRGHGPGFIPRQLMQRWTSELTQFGHITAPHAEQWGGLDMGWLTHLMVFEEIVYSSLDVAIPGFINAVGIELIRRNASSDLQDRYLPGLVAGELFVSIGISEPDVGSDVAAVKTRAVRDGDHWIINGEKTWITNGAYSDILICTCRTGDDEISHILIDRAESPYEVRDIEKMALNGQSTAQIFLTDCRVPAGNTLGQPGDGLRNTLKVFEIARCHMAMWSIGIARRALDEAIAYAKERTQHGRKIAGHQLIADKLATMATQIDAARLLTHRAIALVDAGIRAETECAMAKWFATEMAIGVTRDALQIHGGNGVTRDFIVERLAREAIICPIPDGTTEIQKLIIARALTGIGAFR